MWKKPRSPLGCLLVIGFLLVSGLAGLIVLALRHSGEQFIAEVPYADQAHRLRLLKTQDGPLDYTWKPPLSQSLFPSLGPRVPRFEIHLSGLDRRNNLPGHTFLFRTVDAAGRYAAPPGIWPQFDFVESTGYVFSDRIGMPDFPHWGTFALTRNSLPRRDKELKIRIKDPTTPTAKPVEMTIPNPCYRDIFPVWQSETLPVEKMKGLLTVQLKSCNWQHGRLNPEFTARSTDTAWVHPHFQFVLHDATGNVGEILSPFEPVWKLKTSVYRSANAEFPATDRDELEKLPILAPGTVKALDQKLQVGGLECRVLCIAGAGIVRESQGQFTAKPRENPDKTSMFSGGSVNGQNFMEMSRPNPFVWIELLEKLPHGERIEVQYLRDGQRTACSLGHIETGDRSFIVAELPVAAGVAEVDLTFAVSCPEEYEFFITPPMNSREELIKLEHQN